MCEWLDYEDSFELMAAALSTPEWVYPEGGNSALTTWPVEWDPQTAVCGSIMAEHSVAILPRHDRDALVLAPFSFIRLHRFRILSDLHEPLNEALREVALLEEQNEPGQDSSNIGGYHSKRELWTSSSSSSSSSSETSFASREELAKKKLVEIIQEAMKMVEKSDAAARGSEPGVLLEEVPEGWLNVSREGHWNQLHTHPGCHYSGSAHTHTSTHLPLYQAGL
jgi:hypothetical protein